jgi:ribosomal protein S18 acetylase RimI-like enzyme
MSRLSLPGQGALDLIGLNCVEDLWLSDIVGLPCYNIQDSIRPDSLDTHLGAPAFFTARVDVNDLVRVDALSVRGFKLVDTALTLRHEPQTVSASPARTPSIELVVDAARPDDVDAVVSIAGTSFRSSRFHLDPLFPSDAADRIKCEWARNLASGERGVGCLVVRMAERIVAFLGYLHLEDPEPTSVIDLIAVDTGVQGTGVGTAIVTELLAASARQGRAVIVGTQAANRGSVRLYEGLGFRFDSASYVLHGHLTALENS